MIGKRFQSIVVWATTLGLVGYYLVSGMAINPAFATTAAGAFTNTGAATEANARRGTDLLVMDVTLPMTDSDTLIDADGVFGVTFGTAVIAPTVVDSGAVIAFDTADNVFWNDANNDGTYDAGELLWKEMGGADDGDYDPVTDHDVGIIGNAVATPGIADSANTKELTSLAATGLLHFSDGNANSAWDSGEDIVVDANDNNVYNNPGGDSIVDSDGVIVVTDSTVGAADITTAGTALTSFVDGDHVWLYDADGDGVIDAGDLIWYDGDDDGDYNNTDTNDVAMFGAVTAKIVDGAATNLITARNSNAWAYYTAAGTMNLGTLDIYLETATYPAGRLLNADKLNAITVANTGTAVSTLSTGDISNVNVYLENTGDTTLQIGGDTWVGGVSATPIPATTKSWALAGLTQTITATSKRIYVVAHISGTAINGRTAIFQIPQLVDTGADGARTVDTDLGVFFGSTNDGPSDAVITNANTQTVYVGGSGSAGTVPGAPTNVTVGSATNSSLTISWGAGTNASHYQVYRATNTNNTGMMIADVTGLSYVDTGLSAGTTYYYLVQSISSNGGLPSTNQTQVAGATTLNGQTVVVPTQPTTPATPATPSTPATPTLSVPVNPPAVAINPNLFNYRAQWMGQSGVISADGYAHEISGTPGQVMDLELTLKNVGTAPWKIGWGDGAQWIKLGTWKPQDGSSSLHYSSWLSSNRLTVVNVQVDPNGQYTFHFQIQIPSTAAVGSYTDLYVRPVAEFVKWFGDTGIFWRVRVV